MSSYLAEYKFNTFYFFVIFYCFDFNWQENGFCCLHFNGFFQFGHCHFSWLLGSLSYHSTLHFLMNFSCNKVRLNYQFNLQKFQFVSNNSMDFLFGA